MPDSQTTKRKTGKRWVLHTGAMNSLLQDVKKAVEDGKYSEWLHYHLPKYKKYYRDIEL